MERNLLTGCLVYVHLCAPKLLTRLFNFSLETNQMFVADTMLHFTEIPHSRGLENPVPTVQQLPKIHSSHSKTPPPPPEFMMDYSGQNKIQMAYSSY